MLKYLLAHLKTWFDNYAPVVLSTSIAVVHWRYLPQFAIALFSAIAIVAVARAYQRRRKAWLSRMTEDAIRAMRKERLAVNRTWSHVRLRPGLLWRRCGQLLFRAVETAESYVLDRFSNSLREPYLPSSGTVIAIVGALAILLFVPHPPTISWQEFQIGHLWKWLESDLSASQDVSKVFDGLIIVVIALIIFVAESIRNSRSSDEARVLLQISHLWLLAVMVTIAPFALLYPPTTGLAIIGAGIIALLTVWGFARVLRNFLDVDAYIHAQRKFLKTRVRSHVLESARQRVGNRILYDKLGTDKDIKIATAITSSWLPGRRSGYVMVDTPGVGILTDINLDLLADLSRFLEHADTQRASAGAGTTAQAGGATAEARGPVRRRFRRRPPEIQPNAYLLRRFRDTLPEKDSLFAGDVSVLAIPKRLAQRPFVIEEVRSRARDIFKFSDADSPSVAFVREMQSTKNRLIKAIRETALGDIDEVASFV